MKIIQAEKKHFSEINSLIEDEFPYTKKTIPEISLRERQGSSIFVAEEKKVFMGFIEFKLKGFEASLLGIAVKKEFRKKSIGKKLFDFFIEYCKKNSVKKISLLVKKENLHAKTIYKSRGFAEAGELEKKIDGFVINRMQLTLDEGSAGVN
ncbi:MAG: GNAT family N-acetyltransferase [archaeon]